MALSTPADVLAYCNERCAYFATSGAVATSAVPLDGGTANYVYRVALEPRGGGEDGDQGALPPPPPPPTPTTLVLKHHGAAARVYQDVPLGQARYFAEKEALLVMQELGEQQHQQQQEQQQQTWRVGAPPVLHADDDAYVLLLADAGGGGADGGGGGGLRSLFDLLSVSPPDDGGPSSAPDPAALADALASRLAALGRAPLCERRRGVFRNPAGRQAVRAFICGGSRRRAAALGLEREYGAWLDRLESGASAEEGAHPSAVLTMGDLWPNGLFWVREDGGDKAEGKRGGEKGEEAPGGAAAATAWLLDWELARLQRPLADAQQMAANLWLMEQLPEKYDAAKTASFRRRLLRRAAQEWPGERADCAAGKELFLTYVLLIVVDVHVACWGDWGGEDGRRRVALKALDEVETVFSVE